MDNIEGILNIDINDVSDLDDYTFKVAVSIYGAHNLTMKHAGEIMKMLKVFYKMTAEFIKERPDACNSIEEAKEILSEEHTDYLTEHKFKQKTIERELYREPLRFTMGNEAMEDEPGEFRCIRHQGMSYHGIFIKVLPRENMKYERGSCLCFRPLKRLDRIKFDLPSTVIPPTT